MSFGNPSLFEHNRTSAHIDILEAGIFLSFIIVFICCLSVVSNIRGKYFVFISIRILLSLLIGLVIIVSNFGYAWDIASFPLSTPYKPGNRDQIEGNIEIRIGLRAVNITLRTEKGKLPVSLNEEQIDYNEHFPWTWDQGRIGFGPQAGLLQQTFRKAQLQGVPIPILWAVEYFIIDGEGIRFGRFYRTAGWYTHIAMWTAFPCWILSNILLLSVIRYGGMMLSLTGITQIIACTLWILIRNPLKIIFNNKIISLHCGYSFYLALVNGLFCFFLGILIIVFDLRFPMEIAGFFGLDPSAEYEETYMTQKELRKKHSDLIEMRPFSTDDEMSETTLILKRRTTNSKAQKALFRGKDQTTSSEPMYTNTQQLC